MSAFRRGQPPVALKAYATFRKMLEAVLEGHADRGVLPIENTTAGSVFEAYDSVAPESVDRRRGDRRRAALPARRRRRAPRNDPLHPLSSAGARAVQRVSQRSGDLRGGAGRKHRAGRRRVSEQRDPAQAAIASEEAGAHFGLSVLRRDIANQPVNYTRFVVVAAAPVECDPRIAAKVSVVLATRHEHGALVRCLNVLADEGLNLAKLESRPRRGCLGIRVLYRHRGPPRRAAHAGGAHGPGSPNPVPESPRVLPRCGTERQK